MTTLSLLNYQIAKYIPDDAIVSHLDGQVLVNGEILPQCVILMMMDKNVAYQIEQNEDANSGTDCINYKEGI